MAIEELALFLVIFSSCFIAIHLFIGCKMILKYFSNRRIELITTGLAWIFLSMIWWGVPLYMLSILINFKFHDGIYLAVGLAIPEIALLFWIISVSFLAIPNHKKPIIIIFSIVITIYEIIFVVFLFIRIELIGYVIGGFYFYPSLITLIALACTGIIGLIFALILGKNLFKADDPKIKWKGKFLILAFIAILSGGLLEILFPLDITIFIIARSILLLAGILYYFAFFLPERIANFLVKG